MCMPVLSICNICVSPERPEDGTGSQRVGVRGGCELSDLSARNGTQVLCKSVMNS